jgi:putative transposase
VPGAGGLEIELLSPRAIELGEPAHRKEVLELSEKHPRYGYRRITALMRREGFEVNAKRVARLRREEGIKVSKKQRCMKRLGISTVERPRAERPAQVWSWDFVSDQTENESCFRILTLLDEHTRQCLAIHPGWSIRAVDVITVVEAAIARYGAPENLRSDNGPEFIASCMHGWLKAQEIKDALHQTRESMGEWAY